MTAIRLPRADGTIAEHQLGEPGAFTRPRGPLTSRTAYAAAHVVADPFGDNTPGAPVDVDWEATLAFRRHLWSYGLGVADAMDTAQRGMGMPWSTTAELIRRSAAEARACGGLLACGAGTDQAPAELASTDEVLAAYLEQIEVVEGAGANVIIMASRQLARVARSAEDYAKVYARLLEQVSRPVVLHWLGPMFDPALAGYWGSAQLTEATDTVLQVIADHSAKVDGIKVSMLDEAHEVDMRRRLPDGVRLYTGDDFNYPTLVRGDGESYSHALLGIFDAIAPAASTALQALDRGDLATYDRLLEPTVALSRHLFGAPTYYYKTGIVFLAWLAGHQPGFRMVGGLESSRSPVHLAEVFRLADAAGLLPDPELAAGRMSTYLSTVGVAQ
ncbi:MULTISPECIES: dihydrodipicolinate synthase family protein [unclassified Modestobacter]|uniref:dihydrodipicolinate synthase family protein n=1 Tax=unclassified Modestobacter TaxID=2643866 RepID=UPI0022AA4CEE|nr:MULTISPECIES: dihydrodipicolinate synthase family protein [unclassified Modestobacter]MCZ2822816.1 dihydrodipicolinate synthase family protein [Modestobacter sp. VKM Ac-2981]MCZ2851062.1 dihydrodipicolinate synthase family protein [Modestobacter sp. VKM Ac-2982]